MALQTLASKALVTNKTETKQIGGKEKKKNVLDEELFTQVFGPSDFVHFLNDKTSQCFCVPEDLVRVSLKKGRHLGQDLENKYDN